ncbi:hypothetical protein [Herbaspirillum sp. C9C3]|uniref:hypothetical protein n=1 Tax=Herbaspirillum sp. C9C3 TaxID=2735271 RepID=UPI001585078D|nr:hypothetical protein [Herbaspirillum sp. C9C3]NUT60757.1 hypothetical protein [Herbaspirillum sp. C9C3]
MIEYKKLHIPLPEFKLFEDLANIEWELNRAKKYCSSAQAMYVAAYKGQPVSDDKVLVDIDGLVIAAIIRYTRCFNTGVRFGLSDKDIATISDDLKKFHDHFDKVRSKHVAHSVSAYEQPFSHVHIERKHGEWLRDSIHLSHGNAIAEFNADNAMALEKLIDAVLQIVIQKKEDAHAKALAVFKALPDSELEKFGSYVEKEISPKTVAKPR